MTVGLLIQEKDFWFFTDWQLIAKGYSFISGSDCEILLPMYQEYGVEEGIKFEEPVIEFSYKNDSLGDPLLNTSHALALKLATEEEIKTIWSYSLKINTCLQAFGAECGIIFRSYEEGDRT